MGTINKKSIDDDCFKKKIAYFFKIIFEIGDDPQTCNGAEPLTRD